MHDLSHLPFQSDKDSSQLIVREYALYCFGRFVAQTIGEHTFFSGNMVYGRAMEAAKSNALMRCCKDLGVASELWDPQVSLRSVCSFMLDVLHPSISQSKTLYYTHYI